ncbi:MAG TPA: RES family NAD+ phosphorylase [Thermoanaerobaculia bacterium]|nr:RES family NAD+ phosphorylase [Thermoanaerobaculia bacterium]
MITAWRIVSAAYAETAFTGRSASIAGGRWNSQGIAVVYASSAASLAALELLVHLPAETDLHQFSIFACTFAEDLVEEINRDQLPDDWRGYPPPEELQQLGDTWVMSGSSAVLRVPSVIIDSEFNYLLNPGHRDFATIEVAEPVPFSLDVRLLRRG